MTNIVILAALPILMATLGLAAFKLPFYRQLIAFCAWWQILFEVYIFRPLWMGREFIAFVDGFAADKTGAMFAILSAIVIASALTHACVFFKNEKPVEDSGDLNRVGIFYASSSLFLLAMTLLCICDNLGYMWICLEATTLVSAPLVYYSRNKHALEATWKYLIICSVGIAFALLGTVLVFASSQHSIEHGTLQISELIKNAATLDYPLLRLGFIFGFLGYGTKAGVFPIHSWLPDAHSEAPAPASAMLSGAILNCALLAIWRLVQVVEAAGHSDLALKLPLVLGTMTVAAASLFLVKQNGIKRMWAYSSIENVGLMLTAIGLGSAPLFFLQALNHSLAKVSAFLLAGNIIQVFGSKKLADIRGLLTRTPQWGLLLLATTFAVTGAPPFGSFISEWYMLSLSLDKHLWPVFAILIASLSITFIAVFYHIAACLWGAAPPSQASIRISVESSFIPAILILACLIVGVSPISKCIIQFF